MIAAEQFEGLPADEIVLMLGEHKVKEYAPFNIKKGQLTKKKVKYTNLEQKDVHVTFESDNPELVTVTNHLNLQGGAHDFLRLKILVPNNWADENIQVVVTAFHDGLRVEKLIFNLKLE